MTYDLVMNSQSGSAGFLDGDGQEKMRQLFIAAGHSVNLSVVPPAELQRRIESAARSDSEVLIVGGGDGTVALAARLLLGRKKALGILPLGTFNLAARAAEMPLDPIDSLRALFDAECQSVDVLRVNGRVCLCLTVLGFYPHLAEARSGFRGLPWWSKTLRVLYELLVLAVRTPLLDLTIRTETGEQSLRTRMASFCPGPYEDAAGLLAKRVNLDSGTMVAYLMEGTGRWSLVKAGLGYLTGRLLEMEEMLVIEGSSMNLKVKKRRQVKAMLDGEILTLDLPCEMVLEKRCLQLLRPRQSSDKRTQQRRKQHPQTS